MPRTVTKNDKLLGTDAAAALLKLSRAQFRRICEKLGVEPADSYANRHWKSGPPALLWDRLAILGLKRRKAFRDFVAGAAKRSGAAVTGANTKSARLVEECEKWVPRVERIALGDAQGQAIQSYNDFSAYGCGGQGLRERELATRSSSPQFLRRITRNYIRHHLTDYESTLESIRGRVGTHDAYEWILRPIVEEAIDEHYPELIDPVADVDMDPSHVPTTQDEAVLRARHQIPDGFEPASNLINIEEISAELAAEEKAGAK